MVLQMSLHFFGGVVEFPNFALAQGLNMVLVLELEESRRKWRDVLLVVLLV